MSFSDRGDFWGTTGWDPSACKSNRLHVNILRFSFMKLGYVPYFPLKWSVIFLQSWTSTSYFSNSTGSFVTNCQFSPITDVFLQDGDSDRVSILQTFKWQSILGYFFLAELRMSWRAMTCFQDLPTILFYCQRPLPSEEIAISALRVLKECR